MAELGWVLAVRVVHVGCTVEIDGPFVHAPQAALDALQPVGYTAARQPNPCQKAEKVHPSNSTSRKHFLHLPVFGTDASGS